MLKTFEVNLDIEKDLYTPSNLLFSVSRNDFDSIELLFTILQDGSAFDLTGTTVEFACKKPSGLTVYQECEITSAAEGKARLLMSVQAYAEYGVYTAEVYVRDLDQLAVTSPFYYVSREAVMNTEDIESVNDWSALQEVLFNMDKKPLLFEGVPTTIPEYIGQMAFDITGRRAFIANTISAEGWQLLAAGEGGAGGGIVYWGDILNKPLTFAPTAHTHVIAEVSGLQAALDSKADIGETGGGTPDAHTHIIADVTGLQAELDSKLEAMPVHTHALGDVTGLQAALDGKADNADLGGYAPVDHVHSFDTLTNIPNTFTPSAHTHTTAQITDFATGVAANIPAELLTEAEGDARYLRTVPTEYLTQAEGDGRYAIKGTEGGTVAAAWGDIAGTLANQADLQAALDAKADDAHAHTIAQVTGLQAELDSKLETIPTHTHTAANITDFGTAVAANIPTEYLTQTEGDGRYLQTVPTEYLTEAEGDLRYMATGSAPTAHNHAIGDITGLQAELDSKLETVPVHTHTKAQITDFAHDHTIANITGLQAELDSKLEAIPTHTHTVANITDFATGVAANIPTEYLTEAEGNALYAKTANVYSRTAVDTALAGKSDTDHTHTVANITDFATGVAANIPAEYLTAAEGDAAYQVKGTYLTSVPIASAAQVGGGRVGNGLGITGEYLHVKTGSGLGINAANFALQVQTTNTTPRALNFWTGSQADYDLLAKDPNTLYFITG